MNKMQMVMSFISSKLNVVKQGHVVIFHRAVQLNNVVSILCLFSKFLWPQFHSHAEIISEKMID